MLDVQAEYKKWLNSLDDEERPILDEMCSKQVDDSSHFYDTLHFGTGGLRGKLGFGLNHLNNWTVGAAARGLANYLLSHTALPSVAIARDSRLCSAAFAKRTAEILASCGVHVYFYPRIEPTPALSFAVRELCCDAGVVITASHNPREYNGFKVYGPDGCQATVSLCQRIQSEIDAVDPFSNEPALSFETGLSNDSIEFIDDAVLDAYLESTLKCSTRIDCTSLKVAYTPLNGTGLELCERVMHEIGVGGVEVVRQQADPDGTFPTCPKPNPEVPAALAIGIQVAKDSSCDLLIATDPDCDRVGIAVPVEDEWKILSGNELGLLLLDYLAGRAREDDSDFSHKVAMTTIVSTPAADEVARAYGFELRRTLTGFKFIGEQIGLLEQEDRSSDFLFGFEESCGYLAGTQVRDKCGVIATMLVCEMAAYWKSEGRLLSEASEFLSKKYGYWEDRQRSFAFDSERGIQQMADSMSELRNSHLKCLAGIDVARIVDYATGAFMPVVNPRRGYKKQLLPRSNVLSIDLCDGSRVLVRPSGTEPKLKIYIYARGDSNKQAASKAAQLENELVNLVC